jgi:copper chaperone CopZ
MMAKGLVPGAALAFLIAGTATNVVTIAFVGKKFGRKMVIIYLASIIILALGSGLILDALMQGVEVKEMLFMGRELPYWLKLVSTLIFGGLIIRSFRKSKVSQMREATCTFHVPDMECKHCQSKVEQALKELPGVKNVEVLLDENLVKVEGEADEGSIKEQIKKAGFTAAKRE